MSLPRRTSVVAVSIVLSFAGLASAQAPPTVWHALGIPQGWGRFRDATANRWGNHPNLERKPPLKGLADPANLKSDVPAIKAAAEIKAQQDLAPQKIKAIKYLGQIGCGCYGGVAEALMAALEDCTEVVRLAAAEALAEALSCKCDVCESTCCTPELAAKMYERAYGRDANGCYLEPSERVRAALEQAVAACPPSDGAEGSILIPDTEDTRGIPTQPEVPNIEDRPPGTTPPVPGTLNYRGNDVDPFEPSILQYGPLPGDASSSSRRGQPTPAVRGASLPQGRTPATGIGFHPPVPQVAMTPVSVCGEVVDTRSAKGAIRVVFADNRRPPVGTELDVYHQYVLGTEFAGTLVIRDYEGHHAIAMAKSWENVKVSRGDHVECVMQIPVAEVPPPPTQPLVPPVQTAKQEPTPAQPRFEQPEAEPTPALPPVVASRSVTASPAASAVNKAAGIRPAASVSGPAAAKVVTKAVAPAAPITKPAEMPRETVAEDRAALLDSWSPGETISRATSGVQRVFTLSTEKAAGLLPEAKPESQAANRLPATAPSAISKASPATRTTLPAHVTTTKPVSQPTTAPVVKPSDVTRTTRPAPVTEKSAVQKAAATTPAPVTTTPASSSAFSQMLRLPAEQAAPQPRPATTQSASPSTTSPLTRGSSVVPASANLPAPIVNGTQRLPPVVSADEARRTR